MDLSVGYDNNLYDSDSIIENSAFLLPTFGLAFVSNQEVFGVNAGYEYNSFIPDKSVDIAQSSTVYVDSYWSPTSKNRLSLAASINRADEKRGEGLTENNPFSVEQLDQLTLSALTLGYKFQPSLQNSMFLNLEHIDNHRTYRSGRTDALDVNFEQNGTRISVGYLWESNKQIALATNKTTLLYPDASSNTKDSEDQLTSLSLAWPLTNNSTVLLAVGSDEKHFINTNEVQTADYWSAVWSWNPLSHIGFSIATEQEQKPARRAGETFIEEGVVKLAWSHVWSVDYLTVLELRKVETRSITISSVDVEKNMRVALSNYYRDFELSFSVEQDEATASTKAFSQVELLLSYSFGGGF
ncbi:hypothetical protein CBF23_013775 [Marinomonas agarivorans]|nr:hypothetical protein CBF23_013775 [Marinomonas agarivorans]